MSLRIGIVAAEPSGDQLAAGLMQAIKNKNPDVMFEGIGGPLMEKVGIDSWFAMDSLSVMGVFELLRHLPELFKIRGQLIKRWLAKPPDIFIGVDAPDFNLKIETVLRAQGVKTVHYVCPTVWAWREKRVYTIRQAADLVLSIFPFEKKFLQPYDVRAEYVGHMLANEMPVQVNKVAARQQLGLAEDRPVLAVLPGSRMSEVSSLMPVFMAAAERCQQQLDGLNIVMPLATPKTQAYCQDLIEQQFSELDVKMIYQQSKTVLAAADVVLTASGTATFEALLSKRPMVVGYILSSMTYWLYRLTKMLKMQNFALSNILSSENLAPEFMQQACTAENLTPALMTFFTDKQKVAQVEQVYTRIHEDLIVNTNELAATAVLELLNE